MNKEDSQVSFVKILGFWAPLAATWMMMAVEGPFLAAIIARLSNPKYNLAAYGVAYSLALIVEAPVVMLISASNALARDRDSYLKLRKFALLINGLSTLIMMVILVPPIFKTIALDLIKLPENVAQLAYYSCLLLLPWPGAIGYRRFYQGILISNELPQRVAYGTMIRLLAMGITGLICYKFFALDGALVGGLSLSMGVVGEAIASRIMAILPVKKLLSKEGSFSQEKKLTLKNITRFYYPLALTSFLALAMHPMETFFMGRARMPIESLAVLPVIHSLVFIFRSMGLSFQEVGIAFLGEKNQRFKSLRNFSLLLAAFASGGLLGVAFTPLSNFWFHRVSGLSTQLTLFSILPTKILGILPGLTVLVCFQRAIMVNNRKTIHITISTIIEILCVFLTLFIAIKYFEAIGAVAASLALVLGRVMANLYLFKPCSLALRKSELTPSLACCSFEPR